MRRGREGAVFLAFALVLGAGLAADAWSGSVRPKTTAAEVPSFEERGEFCPPAVRKGKVTSKLVAGSPEHEPVPVGIQPALPQTLKLGADRLLVRKRTSSTGVDVVGYGARVVAASLSQFASPAKGATAVRCSPGASGTWYFAEGTTEIGYDERILIYNPFPAEAVVGVKLFTKKGIQAKANLADIAVHENSATSIELQDFVLHQPSLGASVEVNRGRVVAWRVLFVDAGGAPEGVAATLGAEETALQWHFPAGDINSSAREQVSLLNPGKREATVTVSLVTSAGVVQPAKLVDVVVGPESVKTLVPGDFLKGEQRDPGPASIVVRSTNGVGIVAERTLFYSGDEVRGVSTDIGAPAPGLHWALAPASTRPTGDVVTLLNAGTDKASVSITLVRADGEPLHPSKLQDVALGAGSRIKLPVGHYTKGRPMMALVDATGPIVADRFAYSSADADVATLMGERVRRTAP